MPSLQKDDHNGRFEEIKERFQKVNGITLIIIKPIFFIISSTSLFLDYYENSNCYLRIMINKFIKYLMSKFLIKK